MASPRQTEWKILLALGDLAVFTGAILPTLFLRYGAIHASDVRLHLVPFLCVSVLWITIFYIAGMYRQEIRQDTVRLFRTYLESMLVNFAFSAAFFYLLPFFTIAPRANLFLHFLVSLVLGYAWRMAFERVVRTYSRTPTILFIGASERKRGLEELIQHHPVLFTLTHWLPLGEYEPTIRNNLTLVNTRDIHSLLRDGVVDLCVVDDHANLEPDLQRTLCLSLGTNFLILDLAEFEELVKERVPLAHLSETWLLRHLNESKKSWYEQLKRAIDLLLAIPFGVMTVLMLPFVAVGIKTSSKGPVFYSQERVGMRGQLFRLWKFRTMHTDAERSGPQFTADSKSDPRLFKLGRWLRRLRIDELPQIWNVFRGDLSFIGPRPERPEFVVPLALTYPLYDLRHIIRPGLTGWAQVTYLKPNKVLDDNLIKLQYDLYYLKHRSFVLDFLILLKTIGVVVKREGT